MLYPPKGICKADTKEVQLFLPMSYFVLGNVYLTFNLQTEICRFEILKMLYPPEGAAKAVTDGVPIVFTYVLLG